MTRPTSKRLPKSRIDELSRTFQSMDADFKHCRIYGHVWAPFDAFWLPGRKFVDQSLRCTRCTKLRRSIIDQYGNVVARKSPTYPEGYLLTGLGRLTGPDRSLLRLDVLLDDGVKDGPADDA